MVEQKALLTITEQPVKPEIDKPERIVRFRKPRRVIREPELVIEEEKLRELEGRTSEEEFELPGIPRGGRCGGCDMIMTNERTVGGFTAEDTK